MSMVKKLIRANGCVRVSNKFVGFCSSYCSKLVKRPGEISDEGYSYTARKKKSHSQASLQSFSVLRYYYYATTLQGQDPLYPCMKESGR